MTTGIRLVSRFRLSCSQISKPSRSGSIRSSRMRSGWILADVVHDGRAFIALDRLEVSRADQAGEDIVHVALVVDDQHGARHGQETPRVVESLHAGIVPRRGSTRKPLAGVGGCDASPLAGPGPRPPQWMQPPSGGSHPRPTTRRRAPVRPRDRPDPGPAFLTSTDDFMKIYPDHRRLRLRHLRGPRPAGRLGRVQRDPALPGPRPQGDRQGLRGLIRQVADLCKAGRTDAADLALPGAAVLAHGAGAAHGGGPDQPLQGAGQDQAGPGHGVPHRGHRRAGEPAFDHLDDRPDGPPARPAGDRGLDDRGLRPDRRRREGRPLGAGQRHQPGPLGDRLGPPDRHSA